MATRRRVPGRQVVPGVINGQLLLVVGFALISIGLFASIGWLAAPVCVGVLAIVYSIALEN